MSVDNDSESANRRVLTSVMDDNGRVVIPSSCRDADSYMPVCRDDGVRLVADGPEDYSRSLDAKHRYRMPQSEREEGDEFVFVPEGDGDLIVKHLHSALRGGAQ